MFHKKCVVKKKCSSWQGPRLFAFAQYVAAPHFLRGFRPASIRAAIMRRRAEAPGACRARISKDEAGSREIGCEWGPSCADAPQPPGRPCDSTPLYRNPFNSRNVPCEPLATKGCGRVLRPFGSVSVAGFALSPTALIRRFSLSDQPRKWLKSARRAVVLTPTASAEKTA